MSAALAPLNKPHLSPGKVPVEFIGLARALREKIRTEHDAWEPSAAALVRRARPRKGFRRLPTKQLAQEWANLPGAGARLILFPDSRLGVLTLIEMRMFPTRLRMPEWEQDADELALSLGCVRVRLDGDVLLSSRAIFTYVGLHALGRRYERGADRSDAAVMTDLARIFAEHATTIKRRGPFNIDGWCGEVSRAAGSPVLSVRTFVG